MKKILGAASLLLALTACKKNSSDDTSRTDGNNNSGSFSPPTTSYWKIKNADHMASADGVQVNLSGSSMGLAKRFDALGYNYCHLHAFFSGNPESQVRAAVPEGGYKAYPITRTNYTGPDSIHVEFSVDDMNSASQGNYFFRATGGRVYVSKHNGKLRYTSDGTLQAEGVKYPNMQAYSYTSNTSFSLVQP
ncbi:hypothetical protein [Flaviaesturariibacter amylovorans]|uniref:Lipoprotein n=1 Tax=Flaviaesturariibacter amylovorans TaxID=1084520 RepID=A0ABP8HSX6_9BACT